MWASSQSTGPYSSILSKDDKSDRKTLEMLCLKLDKQKQDKKSQQEAVRKSNRVNKGTAGKSVKDSGISKSKVTQAGSSSKISNMKVKTTLKENGVTVTDNSNWIKKNSSKTASGSENIRSRSKSKSSKQDKKKDKWKQSTLMETFNRSLEKPSTKSSKEKEKKKRSETLTNSFEKYSIKTPSHEEIMAYRKQSEHEKEALEKLQKEMEDSIESDINFNFDETVAHDDVTALDCKHLTDDEVNEHFNKNFKHMYEIHHGIKLTSRSEKFKKGGDTRDLRYNTSSCTFTYEQKKLLYSLLHDKFGDENFMCTNDQYFFQVLIPELCLRIFMDVHDMTLEEATNYLDNAPVKKRI